MSLTLYSYFRSSAAYRVRIALNLKGIKHDYCFVNLIKEHSEQHTPAYREINPQELVPAVQTERGDVLTQSLAIIEYLEERHPEPSLLPGPAMQRAKNRAFAQAICCDIHPLNNLRVLNYLRETLNADEGQISAWYQQWITAGFSALEEQLHHSSHNAPFCFGGTPTLADVCLIPQIYNAHRFNIDMSAFGTLDKIYNHCLTLEAFQRASPDNQPDNPVHKEA